MSQTAALLEDPELLRRAPADWLFEVRNLLADIRLQAALSAQGRGGSWLPVVPDLASLFSVSRLPALSLYGRVELFGTPGAPK